jgi:hypothetical protein
VTCKIGSSSCASKREGVVWHGDNAIKLCWRRRCRVGSGSGIISPLSHAGNSAAESMLVITHQGVIADGQGAVIDHRGITVDHQGATVDHLGDVVDRLGAAADRSGATNAP